MKKIFISPIGIVHCIPKMIDTSIYTEKVPEERQKVLPSKQLKSLSK